MAQTTGTVDGRPFQVFDLEQPRFQGMPIHEAHQPGYLYVLYRRHADGLRAVSPSSRSSASGLIVAMEHSGTHIDALCHQAEDQALHGGVNAASATTPLGFSDHGVEQIDPIVAPGILLDIPRFRGIETLRSGDVVMADEIDACAAQQGVEITAGSVVLVRTGNGQFWNDPDQFLPGPGMDGSVSRLMAAKQVRAVGADNMAWDVIGRDDPELGCQLPGHLLLLVRAGIYIIENLYLEELAAAEQWSFSFVCTPLKFTGATGSPVRPIALVTGACHPLEQK